MLALCASPWPLRSLSQHPLHWLSDNAEFMLGSGLKGFLPQIIHAEICMDPAHIINHFKTAWVKLFNSTTPKIEEQLYYAKAKNQKVYLAFISIFG